jgi:hypothetical protein
MSRNIFVDSRGKIPVPEDTVETNKDHLMFRPRSEEIDSESAAAITWSFRGDSNWVPHIWPCYQVTVPLLSYSSWIAYLLYSLFPR